MMKDILDDLLFMPSPDERPPRLFASPEELKQKIIISDTPPKEPLPQQAVTGPEAVLYTFPYIVPYPPDLDEEDSPPLSPKSLTGQAKRRIVGRIESAAGTLLHHGDTSYHKNEQMQRAQELEELMYIFSQKLARIDEDVAPGLPESGDNSIMANLSEPQLKKLVKADANSLITYTQNNLGRMYPFGLRLNSSNANPYIAWAHGFQLAAINIQGQDRPCWITQALFDGNGRCGFVKKPPILLPTTHEMLQPEHSEDVDPKLLLKIKVLMGCECYKAHTFSRRHDLYVKIGIDGFPSDKAKKKTDVLPNDEELNWEHQLFEFPIRVPEIAVLRLEVWDRDRLKRDNFVGQACFSVAEIKAGIRVVSLRSRDGESLQSKSKLLCWVQLQEWEIPL